jgi:hypothetical protein
VFVEVPKSVQKVPYLKKTWHIAKIWHCFAIMLKKSIYLLSIEMRETLFKDKNFLD